MNTQTKTRYILIAKLTANNPNAAAVYKEVIKFSTPAIADEARKIAKALGVNTK